MDVYLEEMSRSKLKTDLFKSSEVGRLQRLMAADSFPLAKIMRNMPGMRLGSSFHRPSLFQSAAIGGVYRNLAFDFSLKSKLASVGANLHSMGVFENKAFLDSALLCFRSQDFLKLQASGTFDVVFELQKNDKLSQILKNLAELESSHIEGFQLDDVSDVDLVQCWNSVELPSEVLQELEPQVREELSSQKPIKELSPAAKKTILVILILYKLFLESLLTDYLKESVTIPLLQSFQESFFPEQSSSGKRKSAVLCRNMDAHDLFKQCRLIKGSDVNLRAAPNMKADIMMALQKGKVVRVLDYSNRAWLLVEVEDEGELLEGWVSRRYTQHFN